MFRKEKDFVDNLLIALEDQKVIKAIKEIALNKNEQLLKSTANSKKIDSLNQKIKELVAKVKKYKSSLKSREEELASLKDKQSNLEAEKKRLTTEISRLKSDNQKLKEINSQTTNRIKEQKAKILELSNRFEELEDIYKIYQGLSSVSRDSLQGIFKGNSIEEFIFCGVQHENLDSLWEYIKCEAVAGNKKELKDLKEIFRYFFIAHNKVYESPLYRLQQVEIGDYFDEDKHIRGNNSQVRGEIKEVLFRGYINLKTDKVVKKSVVRV